MDYIKLDKKAITSWRVGRIIRLPIWLIVCAAVFIGGMCIPFDILSTVVKVLVILLAVYKIAGIIIYPQIEYRQWGYKITEDRVDIRHGIFFVTHTIVPVVRIQHITVSQGPINRKLGLYEVEMSLASDSFEIPCLSKEVADEIAENLKSRLYKRLEANGQEVRP